MDWQTLRTLRNVLRGLSEEMERGAHFIEVEYTPEELQAILLTPKEGTRKLVLRDDWAVGMVTTTIALAKTLSLGEDIGNWATEWKRFTWATPDSVRKNPYVRRSGPLLAHAEKLLAEYDSNEPPNQPQQQRTAPPAAERQDVGGRT